MSMVRAYCAADGHDFEPERVKAGLRPLLIDDTHGQAWIINEPDDDPANCHSFDKPDDKPAGYAILTWGWSLEAGGRECLLDEFFVGQPGRGLGSRALRELVDAARENGATAMNLETEAPNDRARKLYRRAGFEVEESIWMRREIVGK